MTINAALGPWSARLVSLNYAAWIGRRKYLHYKPASNNWFRGLVVIRDFDRTGGELTLV